MDEITGAIGSGAAETVKNYGLPGFFIVLLLAGVVVLWRALREERGINKELNAGVLVAFQENTSEMAELRHIYEGQQGRKTR